MTKKPTLQELDTTITDAYACVLIMQGLVTEVRELSREIRRAVKRIQSLFFAHEENWK